MILEQCGFPDYRNPNYRCSTDAMNVLDIEIEGKTFSVPICNHHAETFLILYGKIGLGKLMADGRLVGEWRDAR